MAAGVLKLPLGEAIDETLATADRESTPRRYVGASMVAQECERAVWYDWLWASPKEWTGRLLRRFDTGHTMEARVIEYLQAAGFEVHHENPRARNAKKQYAAEWLGGLFRGHLDGFIRGASDNHLVELGDRWHLLEIKAMASAKYAYADDTYETPVGNKLAGVYAPDGALKGEDKYKVEGRWWKTKRRGVKAEQQTYYGQMQAYMGISRELTQGGKPHWLHWGLDAPLDHGLFVAVNTDTEQIHAELVEYEPVWWKATKARTKRVVGNRGDGPARLKETPLYPPCSFCDHREVCHGVTPMQRTCRTCQHAEVRAPGDEGFRGKRAMWLCNLHGHNCGDFVPCDDHLSLKEELRF